MGIRLAQSISLHKDGQKLGLPLYEVEMRRRLWWHLVIPDSRAAENHGLQPPGTDQFGDVQMPSNLNDNDLSPCQRELTALRKQWTVNTFSLLRMHITHFLIAHALVPSSLGCADANARKESLSALRCHLD